MEYFIDGFKKYADFSGRASRKEYWMFILFYIIIYIALSVVGAVIGTAVLSIIYTVVMLVPGVSIAARRLHDIGRTGWWQLIGLIPVLGAIVLIVFLVQDSQSENEYGINSTLS